jgi:hypothetical protein
MCGEHGGLLLGNIIKIKFTLFLGTHAVGGQVVFCVNLGPFLKCFLQFGWMLTGVSFNSTHILIALYGCESHTRGCESHTRDRESHTKDARDHYTKSESGAHSTLSSSRDHVLHFVTHTALLVTHLSLSLIRV